MNSLSKNPIKKILRSGEGKKLKLLQDLVPDINELEQDFQKLSDDELRGKTSEFKGRIDQGESENALIIEAFGVVRETANRVLGQRHYDVQLIGGAALHFGLHRRGMIGLHRAGRGRGGTRPSAPSTARAAGSRGA